MNSTTFLFSGNAALAVAALGGCLALAYAACNRHRVGRLRWALGLGWAGLGAAALCLLVAFRLRYPGFETAPRPAQWQVGALLGAGALMLKVGLLRLGELSAAQAAGETGQAARLARGISLQLATAGVLLGVVAVIGLGLPG